MTTRRSLLAWLAGLPFAGLVPGLTSPRPDRGRCAHQSRVSRPILARLQEWWESWPRREQWYEPGVGLLRAFKAREEARRG